MSYEAIQQAVRAQTGTTGTYEEDWIALFDADGIASGFFNDRLRAWINTKLGTSYAYIADAQRALAVARGVSRFSEMDGVSPAAMQWGAGNTLFWGSGNEITWG